MVFGLSDMDDILGQAIDLRTRALAVDLEPALVPSRHWQGVLSRFHHAAFSTVTNASELVRYATAHNGFVIYRKTDSDQAWPVLAYYLAWLEVHGRGLSSLPAGLEESPHASLDTVFQHQGRRISASFLWHLCAATRLLENLPPPASVLEIGPGFGGLARVLRGLAPASRFVLVDLPDSLAFAYVYLRLHFPEARVVFVTSPSESIVELRREADFLLLPSNLLSLLHGEHFDLAINIASWGEMTQTGVNRYLGFLEQEADIGYLYSINQYGQHPTERAEGRGRRLLGADICHCALPIGPNWRLLHWDFWGEDSFVHADPLMAPCLEVLLRRANEEERTTEAHAALARQRLEEAARQPTGSLSWHRALWDAARLDPGGAGADLFAHWAAEQGYPESRLPHHHTSTYSERFP